MDQINKYGIWNVQDLSNKINEVLVEITPIRVDIAVLAET